MSITDELRRVAVKTETASGRCERLYRGDLERLADAIETELAERYVALPLGADGVPIHVGDSIEIIGGEYGTAVAIELCEDGGWNVSMRPTGWDTPTLFAAESVRHHRPPTVEGILREFALRAIRESEGNYGDLDETCAEYAAKLKLRED